MKRIGVLVILGAMAGIAAGQTIETVIWLPDSLARVSTPLRAIYNPVNGLLYVAGDNDWLCAMDPKTGQSRAAFPITSWPLDMCCNLTDNKVYCVSCPNGMTIIDAGSNQVSSLIDVVCDEAAIAWDSVRNRVYVGLDSASNLLVLDGATDRVLKTVRFPLTYVQAICPLSEYNRVYCGLNDGVAILDASDSLLGTIRPEYTVTGFCPIPGRDRVYCLADDRVLVLDPRTDSVVRVLQDGEEGEPVSIAYDAAADRAYVLDANGSIWTIDCTTDSIIHVLGTPLGYFGWLTFSPEPRRLYAFEEAWGGYIVVDPDARRVLRATLLSEDYSVSWVCTDPGCSRIFATDDCCDQVIVLDCRADSVSYRLCVDPPAALCCNPLDEKFYVAATGSRSVMVFDAATNRRLARVRVGSAPSHLCFNSRQDEVICACSGESLAFIGGRTNGFIGRVRVGSSIRALEYDAASDRIFCIAGGDAVALDGASHAELWRADLGRTPLALCYNSLNEKLYCADTDDSSVTVVDARTGRVSAVVRDVGRQPNALLYHAAGNKVFCASRGRKYGFVAVIDCTTDSVVAKVRAGGYPIALCHDPVNNRVFCANRDSASVTVLDGTLNGVVGTVSVGHSPTALLYSPTTNLVYCTNRSDEGVTLIDATTLRVVGDLAVPRWPSMLAGLPSGNRVYIGCEDWSAVCVVREEAPSRPVAGLRSQTLFDRELVLYGNQPALLFDINGRRQAELQPGVADLRRLPSGVYFVHRLSDDRAAKIVVRH